MANEENIEQQPAPKEEPALERPKKFNSKVIMVGLPVFIVQLVVVYFVTANLLLSKIVDNKVAASADGAKKENAEAEPAAPPKEVGKYIFQIEDVIVNPADTDGSRLLLTSIAFDLGEEKALQDYQSKEVLLKDIILTTLSSKSLSQLSSTTYKDTIKSEILHKVKKTLPEAGLNSVYISKYIIQ